MLDVRVIPILSDNYCFIIQSGNDIGVIDPGEASPVLDYLDNNNLQPKHIFNTHHHGDHVAGNMDIRGKYNCQIIGPAEEADKIKNLDIELRHGDVFDFSTEKIKFIKAAGHTNGHICFYFSASKILFSGDALFSMGCGRLFEGTAEDMFEGFEHIKRLASETKIYCGHEYTLSNAEFCIELEPDNTDLSKRYEEVKTLRQNGKPTIPTTLAQEMKTNLFLKSKTAQELKKLRDLKDDF